MVKRKRLLFSLGILMICLSLLGCGGNGGGGGGNGGGGGVTIRGQVLINGKPASSDQVLHTVVANGKVYLGTTLSENGYFSHGSGSMDHEYCYPGCVVSLVFRPTGATTSAFSETRVYEYKVKAGDNNLGTIDIGLYGFALVSPEDDAEIGPDNWPPKFQWSAYQRTGITPEYIFSLGWGYAGSLEITTEDTSVTVKGDESVTRPGFDEELGLDQATDWTVYVKYEERDHTIRHRSETRKITIIPPEE